MRFKLLLTICLLSVGNISFSQVYRFNRQLILTIEKQKVRHTDIRVDSVWIEVKKSIVIFRWKPAGIGEPPKIDTMYIRSKNKNNPDFFKILTTNDHTILIYSDEMINVVNRERNGNRVERSFYNEKIK